MGSAQQPIREGHCEASEDCKDKGLCGLGYDIDSPPLCKAQSHAHCRQSTACKDKGRCKHEDSECVEGTGRP